MGKLLLLFVIVPAAELALLIQAGIYLGTWPTLALIVFTGIVGAYLARRQGLSVLTRAQKQMARGEVPAGSLADGVMILVAGALLMTPGIFTDAFGFSLLVPGFRNLWNVNGIRACVRRGFVDFLDRSGADILGAQEVRALPEEIPSAARTPTDWHAAFAVAERRGYSGVGIYSKFRPVVPSIYSSARTELDRSPVCRHHACMISSFVRALISARRVPKKRNQLQTGAPGRFGLEVVWSKYSNAQRVSSLHLSKGCLNLTPRSDTYFFRVRSSLPAARPAADLSQPCAPPVGLSPATRSPGVGSQSCGAKYPGFFADSKGV